ncbi:unnamed protein product, partial [Soboliphyme baturini]|uniref:CG15040 n=1 Tax=Soboliphyme baturini TaxID=241478 RepID=A0A183J547_9BILA
TAGGSAEYRQSSHSFTDGSAPHDQVERVPVRYSVCAPNTAPLVNRCRPSSVSFENVHKSGLVDSQVLNSNGSSFSIARSHAVENARFADYNRLFLEENKLLHQGLDKANRLVNWYNERLANLTTRQKLIARNIVPNWAILEAKVNSLRMLIKETNRHAVVLMESSEKGFPLCDKNLSSVLQPTEDQMMWLKRQNQLLTEVSHALLNFGFSRYTILIMRSLNRNSQKTPILDVKCFQYAIPPVEIALSDSVVHKQNSVAM